MSSSSIQISIERLQREISSAQTKLATLSKSEANKLQRISQIRRSITRSTSASMLQSKYREIERIENDIASDHNRRAALQKSIANNSARLHSEQQRLYKEQAREQDSLLASFERRERDLRLSQDTLLRRLAAPVARGQGDPSMPVVYHAFISHATEDKEQIVRPLAERLRDLGFIIWYDEFELKIGDSLRRSIDRGLSASRFGIVVLSPAFFAKNWPQYELDGLVAREMNGGKVILPLWHKVSKDEVLAYSPSLADKLALHTATSSVDELATKLGEVLREEV
jgi:hypothetical protein